MNLESFTKSVSKAPVLLKKELAPGDRVVVNTMHIYKLTAMNTNQFRVSGGYFDRNQASPIETTIAGCEWGDSFVKLDAIAVCGLQLKFVTGLSPVRLYPL